MRPIIKGSEPESLTRHRSKPHTDYDNYEEKDDLRVSLVRDQGALCCYCMQRIHPNGAEMKIEHWLCQDDHPEHDLDYWEFVRACLGGSEIRQPRKFHYCDTRKGNSPLQRNPAVHPPLVDHDIRYLADGSIESKDAQFNNDLNEVLNLNLVRLKNNRKAVLDALKAWAERSGNSAKPMCKTNSGSGKLSKKACYENMYKLRFIG